MTNNITYPDSSSFQSVIESLKNFSLESFNDPQKIENYNELFAINKLCRELEHDRVAFKNNELTKSVSVFEEKPLEPEYGDLCRLHWICLTRKVINILEFGSGFSTAVMADAMRILNNHFNQWVSDNIRVEKPFHIYSIEEDQRFLEISKARLGQSLSSFSSLIRSSVDISLHDNRITTVYSKIPNISPDFIYLDGPSQFATTQEINGFSFASKVRMPMSSDILRFEFFLEPGTLILVDGRTANARFLKSYLRRNWIYQHDPKGDIHFFELQEEPLGSINEKKLNFCIDGKWLLT